MTEGVSRDAMTTPSVLALREQLTNLRALLVLSILMTESRGEDQILNLAASSAPSLGSWRVESVAFVDDHILWKPGRIVPQEPLPAALRAAVVKHGDVGGPVDLPGTAWAWASPLRTAGSMLGYLIAAADGVPSQDERFLIKVVAQQTAVAVSNARLRARERSHAAELATANEALETTVAILRRSTQIHERLTAAAAAGEGSIGIAHVLHELTGRPVAIEDRYGNLRTWAGPDQPVPYPKPRPDQQEKLIRRLASEGRSIRHRSRVVAMASPRAGVVGLLALHDPEGSCDAADLMALEHCATVLAVELARVRGLADAEVRLRRDLLHDLLSGLDDTSAHDRAEALGYDLGTAHRVLLVDCDGRAGEEDDLLHGVRRACRELRLTVLLGTLSGTVVILTGGSADWKRLRNVIVREWGGQRCNLTVGDPSDRPSGLPRSLRQAQLALKLQQVSGNLEQTTVYDDLGVFRLFAALPDPADIDGFARRWLGALIDYDEAKGADLVDTLTQYLAHGGRYTETAEVLCIHRSTLKYRLQRIKDLTGFDLHDAETSFNLQLATRSWTVLQALHR